MKRLFVILLGCFTTMAAWGGDKSEHVILVTIDGMRPEMITDSLMPTANLKRMKRDGMFVSRIKGIVPTATYPSHTTIVTGTQPAEHKIYYNSPFVDNKNIKVSNWYADSIKSPTIWDRVHQAGMKVASLFWPVSTGCKSIDYNVPEFWSVAMPENQLDFIKPYCTPYAFLEELERNAVGHLDHENFMASSMMRDCKTAAMANYIMNTYAPGLMTIHLITTDYSQHATGLSSDWVTSTVESADNAIGLIIENLERHKMMDNTTLIVCGDHGFADVDKLIAPNVWLVNDGLLSEKAGGEWKACFHGSGAMMFLYLKNDGDKKTLAQVKKIIAQQPASVRSLFRVVEKDELRQVGCDPKVALAIEPVKGVGVATRRVGDCVIERKCGEHGYLSGYDPTALVAIGKGIDKKTVAVMDQREIAPWVLSLLGVDSEEK